MSNFIKVEEQLKKGIKLSNLKCKNCGTQLEIYKGRYGKFIGCPNFNGDIDCKYTASIYGSNKNMKIFENL